MNFRAVEAEVVGGFVPDEFLSSKSSKHMGISQDEIHVDLGG